MPAQFAQIVSPDSKIDSSYTSGTGTDSDECFDAAVQWGSGKGVRDEKSSVMNVLMRRVAVKKRVIGWKRCQVPSSRRFKWCCQVNYSKFFERRSTGRG
jgi:hypothetical protein